MRRAVGVGVHLALGAALLFAAGASVAQGPGSGAPTQPGGGPGAGTPEGAARGLAAPAAAPPETLDVAIAAPPGSPAPRAITVVPGQSLLGEAVAVVLDFPAAAAIPAADSLSVGADWLERGPVPDRALAGLAPAAGPRLVLGLRPYRLGPWRPAWPGGPTGPVHRVVGRLTDADGLVPVRDPRALGGLPRWLPWLLAAGLLGLAAWILWSRLRGGRRPADAWPPPPPPAWLQAARDLHALQTAGAHDRRFLDRLAVVVRRYVEGRYGLPASGMAAKDLARVAREAAWPATPLRGAAELLEACDRARYAPAAVDAVLCRDALAAAVRLVAATRIQASWTEIPPAEQAEADAAWRALCEAHGHALAPGEVAPC